MKVHLIFCIILFIVQDTVAIGQPTFYDWEKERKRYTLSKEEQSASELVLKHHTQYQYALEDNQFIMYATTHKIIWVNNSEAVQKHNRIFISMNSTIELAELKARAIGKDGNVVYFNKDNLKELKEEESGNAYRIFAIEGVELGSEIEYYFTRKMQGGIYDRVAMQQDVAVKESSFTLTCPSHLKFDFKSYYGYPKVKQKESATEESKMMNEYTVSMTDVPALKEEPFSYYEANRMRIEFKLAYNTVRSQARLYTWEDAGKTFYSVLYTYSKEDVKSLEKFVKTLGDDRNKSTEQRIRNVEQKIKAAIQVNSEGNSESTGNIAAIVKYKVASKEGITRLYAAVFEKLAIACNPVITCSREKIKFDGDFDTWSYLDEYLLYFPDTQAFIAPFSYETRYPLVPADFTEQQGLFIEPLVVGDVKSALTSINKIPAASYELNVDDLTIDVEFNTDLTGTLVHQLREFGGYNSIFFAPYYDLMTEEQRVKMVEELTKQTAPDAVIKKWTGQAFPTKKAGTFLFDVTFESSHFIEKAGPRILFKVGQLIGPQTEMYRDDVRMNDVENDFNRGYERLITVHLPTGYTIKNARDLNIDIVYKNNDQLPFVFQSTYELKENTLEIRIKEYYKEIFVPVKRYEDFRKVINAAADFNKVTLVLEKAK